jgi:hypothetical protein
MPRGHSLLHLLFRLFRLPRFSTGTEVLLVEFGGHAYLMVDSDLAVDVFNRVEFPRSETDSHASSSQSSYESGRSFLTEWIRSIMG